MREHLLGRKSKRLVDKALDATLPGVFGVCAGNFDVKEANKRGSLHNHGLFHGGITRALLSYVAEYPKLVLEATEALDTQVTAALPLEFHQLRDYVAIANNTLRVAKRRDQASSQAPEPPLLPDPGWENRHLQSTKLV